MGQLLSFLISAGKRFHERWKRLIGKLNDQRNFTAAYPQNLNSQLEKYAVAIVVDKYVPKTQRDVAPMVAFELLEFLFASPNKSKAEKRRRKKAEKEEDPVWDKQRFNYECKHRYFPDMFDFRTGEFLCGPLTCGYSQCQKSFKTRRELFEHLRRRFPYGTIPFFHKSCVEIMNKDQELTKENVSRLVTKYFMDNPPNNGQNRNCRPEPEDMMERWIAIWKKQFGVISRSLLRWVHRTQPQTVAKEVHDSPTPAVWPPKKSGLLLTGNPNC